MSKQPTLFGIANCDTVRKTRRFLDGVGCDYRFHDLRSDGLDQSQIDHWLAQLALERLVNRRSTSWRSLSAAERDALIGGDTAILLAHPTLIKRPLLETSTQVLVGFNEDDYREALNL